MNSRSTPLDDRFTAKLRILCLFGTRPEVIKVAPVVKAINKHGMDAVVVNSGQHRDLVKPLMDFFGIKADYDLEVMREGQTLNGLASRVLKAIDPVIAEAEPDMILVQGDTTTALAGALSGFHRGVPVGHIEAGLRSGDPLSPWPEEMNRRLISKIAMAHFAATERNRDDLLGEGIDEDSIFLTGNPVLSALHHTIKNHQPAPELAAILKKTEGKKRVILTSHRRENFGKMMEDHLREINAFISQHKDSALIFPVHPNPRVREAVQKILKKHNRIHLIDPMPYPDFVCLLSEAELIVSDSGGIQEEAPSLRKPLLVLRENTERPESIEAGVSRLMGSDCRVLRAELEQVWSGTPWAEEVKAGRVLNPFGDRTAAEQIASAVEEFLGKATVLAS